MDVTSTILTGGLGFMIGRACALMIMQGEPASAAALIVFWVGFLFWRPSARKP